MKGRRLAAGAVAAALLVPAAPAAADPLTVGRDKVGERVSAECRRAGALDDERCWSGVGRKVVRAAVEAFERSELARTLRFQQRLGDGLPLHRAPWIGTHNSYNSTSELPTVSHTDSNQQLPMVDQLRLGVRSLEVDLHWLPSARAGGAFAPVVCHGQQGAGCSTERLLGEHLAELVAWLEANPDEVLLLYLEDQIGSAGYAHTADVVRRALGERLYAPRGEGCRNIPLTLTRDAVREAGAQVVIVGSCGTGAWQQVSHAWPGSVRFESRPRNWSCEQVPRDGRIVRFYEDSTWLSQTPASSPDDGLSPETTRAMDRCGVTLLGFDQLLPGDGRLEALAWSWAEGEPHDAEAAVQREDGRWVAVPADGARPAACKGDDGSWTLTPPVARTAAAVVCRSRGAAFDPPRTAAENAALEAAGGAGAWLGL
jgi:hypothetical protein